MHILVLHIAYICILIFYFILFYEGVSKIPETIIKDIQKLQTDFFSIKELCEKFEKNLDNLMSRAEMKDGTIPLTTTSAHQLNNETVAIAYKKVLLFAFDHVAKLRFI